MVLVTHGHLAEAFRVALEERAGPQAALETICIGADDDMEQRRRDILAAVERTQQGQGVVLITDMFGGTPSNLAISMLDRAKVEVIAGVNLPMLLALAERRGSAGLAAAAEAAAAAAREAIVELPGGPAPAATGAGQIGILVLGHGRLAADFQAATEHVVGPQSGMRSVGASPTHPPRRQAAALAAAVEACEAGRGVIVAVDADDGASTEQARSLAGRAGVRVIRGVNLPMLIKLASVRDQESLDAAVASALEAGRKYISVASALLSVDKP